MLGAGVQFNKSRNGDDRFYSAARARRSQDFLRRARSDVPSRRSRRDELPPEKSEPEAPAVSEISPLCNLERFLGSVTPSVPAQRLGEESDSEYFRDSSSDGSSDSEQDRGGLNYSREQLNYLQTSDSSPRVDHLLREQNMAFQEGFSCDEGESGSSQKCLLFEYFARDQPYCREPLADKILDLAHHFLELKTLRSCDLLPSSWISVAWYPIYRIPTGPTLKDLDACFFAFHSLHTPMTEALHPPKVTHPSESDDVPYISLPALVLLHININYHYGLRTRDISN